MKEAGLPEEAYEIMRKSISNPNNHGYTNSIGTLECRVAVAKHFKGPNMELGPNDVVMVSGANMGLFVLLLSMCNSGDNILVPETGYPFFHKVAPALGVEVRPYKLIPEKSWQIDLGDADKKIDLNTRFIWIINPSNPGGSIFSKSHMLEILALSDKHKIPIVSDEV